MTRTLVVSTLAESDLAEAATWYNQIRPDLGSYLMLCVEEALDRILDHPEAFPTIMPQVVRRFPYGVFFRIRQDRIEVEALFHLRAGPSRLPERLGHLPKRDS